MSELRQLRGQGVFQPYRAPSWAGGEKAADGVGKTSTDRGKWNMCAPPNPWTAILPRTDTGLLLLVMAGDGSSGVQLLLAASRGGGIHRREFEALSQDRRAPPLRHPKGTRTPLHTHTSARKFLLS